jgi:hypothetical protein
MSMRVLVSSLAVLALTACGSGPNQQAQTNEPQIAVRSPEQDRLHQLSDMERDIGLKRAIIASGLRCKRVTKSGYVQEHKKLSMWMASCDDGRDWGIFVGADGSAQVRPCVDLARLGLPECRIAADPSGRTARAAGSGSVANSQ